MNQCPKCGEPQAARAQPAQAETVTYWQRGTTQPAQAGQVLSEEEMLRAILPLCHDDIVARLLVENSGDEYRAIEAAVLAKVGIVGKEGE